MKSMLISANIVVLANSFNASIATKDWLLKHVIDEEPEDFIITPVVSVYKTKRIELLVDQSRLQVQCIDVNNENLELCHNIVASYVNQLPHTPYTAIGFNYVLETPAQTDNNQVKLHNRLASALSNLDIVFSQYSVGPNILGQVDGAQVRINFDPSLDWDKPIVIRVNYHYDCNDWQSIAKKAATFTQTCEQSKQLVSTILYEEENNVD